MMSKINEEKLEELTEYLDNVGKWAEDYVFDNSDYADSYYTLVCEDQIIWLDRIEEWIEDNYPHFDKSFARAVWENIDPGFDSEAETHRCEYAGYSGKGCCIGAFGIGEYEEQLDFSDDSVCSELHESGELDDYLDEYNGDVYPCRSQRRELNESTGRYEPVGRETYTSGRGHDTLEVIVGVGGQVRFVIPESRMRELITETVLQLAAVA
jgi:hypothetical protein